MMGIEQMRRAERRGQLLSRAEKSVAENRTAEQSRAEQSRDDEKTEKNINPTTSVQANIVGAIDHVMQP